MTNDSIAMPPPLIYESSTGYSECDKNTSCAPLNAIVPNEDGTSNHGVGNSDSESNSENNSDSSTEENSINGDDDSHSSSSILSSTPSFQSALESHHEDISPVNNQELLSQNAVPSSNTTNNNTTNNKNNTNAVWNQVVRDFDSKRGGDFKILRAIGRTAAVNAVVSVTALVAGPVAGVAGYVTGGAITAKRLVGDGNLLNDQTQPQTHEHKKEIAKSLAVFGGATSASLAGQAVAGAVMIGLVGASLPVAGVVAFSVGCVSGITAGSLSEWGVDGIMNGAADHNHGGMAKTSEPKTTSDANRRSDERHPNLVDSVGAWLDRQRQRQRQCKLQREATRQRKVLG